MLAPCMLALWAVASGPPAGAAPRVGMVEAGTLGRLLEIQRVYVDRFAGGESALQIRDMIISSLQAARLFILTENEATADAFLRGSAEDLIFTETYAAADDLSVRASAATGSNPDRTARDRRSRSASVGVGERESTRLAERKHEATASLRLVSKEGDILWSTTQHSLGAKFRSAGEDVAEKVARELLKAYSAARDIGKSKINQEIAPTANPPEEAGW